MSRKILYAFSIEPEQLEKLRVISKATRTAMSEYIRQGIQIILKKNMQGTLHEKVREISNDDDWSKP